MQKVARSMASNACLRVADESYAGTSYPRSGGVSEVELDRSKRQVVVEDAVRRSETGENVTNGRKSKPPEIQCPTRL